MTRVKRLPRAPLVALAIGVWLGPQGPALATDAAEAARATPSTVEPPYRSALDAPMLYQILIGEIEARRGDLAAGFEVLLDAARRTVSQSTRQAYFAVQSGLAQVKALEAAESSSRLALEATQVGYRVGVRVNLDVLNAQTQLFQTRRDLAKARYDVLLGGLRLRLASGQLRVEDLGAVSGLLEK